MRRTASALSIAGLLGSTLLMPPAPAAAAGFVVTNINDSGAGSLRDAIDQANALPGLDTITFTAGLSGTILLFASEMIIFDNLIIDGTAAPAIDITGNDSSRVFGAYGADLELRNLQIRDGRSLEAAGAVFVDGDLTLRNVDINDSDATTDGGGAYVTGSAFVYDSEISENGAEVGGGLAVVGSTIIENSTIRFNTATEDGGGVAANGTLSVNGSIISNNLGCTTDSENGGGGISSGAAVTISNSTIDANTCDNGDGGGGISATNETGGAAPTLLINGSSSITDNEAEKGGGVYAFGVNLEVSNSDVSGNDAIDEGGGVFINGEVGNGIPNLGTDDAGLLDDGGLATIDSSTFSNNSAGEEGGAIWFEEELLTIINSTFDQNTSGSAGGAIYAIGKIEITGGTMSDNSGKQGGALDARSLESLVITGTTFSSNNSENTGGAVFGSAPSVEVVGARFEANSAQGDGGGIALRGDPLLSEGVIELDNVEMVDNVTDRDGGAISAENFEQFTLRNSMLGNNTAGETGGGLHIDEGTAVNIEGSAFTSNTSEGTDDADPSGGGAFIDETISVTVADSRFTANEAIIGGGLVVPLAETLSVINSIFEGNTATEAGGGALVEQVGDLAIEDSRFTQNEAGAGGGLTVVSAVTASVSGSKFDANIALSWHGGAALVAGDVRIENSTFVENAGQTGGGIFIRAETASISNTTIDRNIVGGGLGVFNSGELTIADSAIRGNEGQFGGGIALSEVGATTLTDSVVSDNVATFLGGGIRGFAADLTIESSSIDANSAGAGGGIEASDGTLELRAGTTVDSNTATVNGGGVNGTELALTTSGGVSISGNAAVDDTGGGIYMASGSIDLTETVVTDNTAGADGGGIWSSSSMTITTSSIAGNTSELRGGGIWSSGRATVAESSVTGNSAATDGGGISSSSALTVETSSIDGNTAAAEGGGVFATDSLLMNDSSITGNTAAAEGGGVSGRTVRTNRSLFTGNSAGTEHNGGALRATVDVVASNSTFHGNTAGGTGGAINLDGDVEQGRAVLRHLTITDNDAGVAGGGVFATDNGFSSATSSIVDNNTAPESPDIVFGEAPTWSIIGDLGATSALDGDGRPSIGLQVGLDPLLGPLSDNGGPTHTRLPLPRSQVIDAGGSSPETSTDQRGIERPADSLLDIGAVEYNGALPVWVPVTPARLVDTRSSGQTIDGDFRGAGTLEAGGTLRVDIAGRGGVPVSAAGAIVNVTAINPESVGFLTVFPCTETPPNASSVNYTTGVNLPNEVIAGLDDEGTLCVFSSARTQLAIDVVGYLGGPSPFRPVNPSRLLDTRQTGVTIDGQARAGGRTPVGGEVMLQVSGRAGIPDTAVVAVVNVVAINPSATGFVAVHSCLDERPLTSSLNYIAGGNRGNEILANLDDDGQVCVFTSSESHLVVDVVGYLDTDLDVTAVEPARVFETRAGTPTVDGELQDVGRLQAGSTTKIQLSGRADVPDGAATVNINVTAINAELNGFLTVFACGDQPLAASVNYIPGVNGGNDLISGINAIGELCVFTSAETDLTIDITGYTTL